MIVGTRGSRLAMAQADMAIRSVRTVDPGASMEIKVVSTGGDRDRCTPLGSMGGYGVFTKELDQRLLSGEIDLAVNSLKDMPSELTPGTCLAAVLPRGAVHDVLVSKVPLPSLPSGASVGTSSVRRRAFLLHARPDLRVEELRGNITTRVGKWKRGEHEAIVLAAAGLERLGESVSRHVLDPMLWTPPAGQGAVALVCREGDAILGTLRAIDHRPTRACVDLERAIMSELGASCQEPLGVWATPGEGSMVLRCSWASPAGEWLKRFEAAVPWDAGRNEVRDTVLSIIREWRWPT